MELFGLRIDAEEAGAPVGSVLRVLAGPLAGGALYALLRGSESGLLRCCAEFSRRLTLFNLLPVSCLDGGGAVRLLLLKLFPQTAERKAKLLNLLTLFFCLLAALRSRFFRKS